jgi:uncharacterized protein (TIGR03437 family)
LLGVLSDGRVLGSDSNGLLLWSPSSGKRTISGTAGLELPLISDNGAAILAIRPLLDSGGRSELISVAVDSARQISLGTGLPAGISNDGRRALVFRGFLPAEVDLVDLATGTREPLLPGVPVNSAALAGFGRWAILATTDGRLLKVDIDSRSMSELVPRTPILAVSVAVPCSAFPVNAANVEPTSIATMITLDGQRLPVLGASESVIWLQVPCELPLTPASRLLDVQTASPFATAVPLSIRQYWPVRVAGPMHQDFSGPVTEERPATPGEIVHLWVTGLGPVDRAMRTGEPGPESPPARVLYPMACGDSLSRPIEVLFAGLAPGLVGFYQIDLRVPVDARRFFGGTCVFPDNASTSFHMTTTGQP